MRLRGLTKEARALRPSLTKYRFTGLKAGASTRRCSATLLAALCRVQSLVAKMCVQHVGKCHFYAFFSDLTAAFISCCESQNLVFRDGLRLLPGVSGQEKGRSIGL